MVLSNSRYKFSQWQTSPFTSKDLIKMHNLAFKYFNGMPKEIVYDQDRPLFVNEEAILKGYRVAFTTMNELMYILKTKNSIRKSKIRYNRIMASQLWLLDEVGYTPITKEEAKSFFSINN